MNDRRAGNTSTLHLAALGIVLGTVALAACGGGNRASVLPALSGSGSVSPGTVGSGAITADQMNAVMPTSLSPELVSPSPMPTAGTSSSSRGRSAASVLFTPLPAAPAALSSIVISPKDGTLWGVGSSSSDGHIYQFVNNAWQQFTAGIASSLAIDAHGDLYAVSAGTHGVYEYAQPGATPGPGISSPLPIQTWFPIGGNASAITTTSANAPFILSYDGSPNHAVWSYGSVPQRTGFHWTQQPGTGVSISGSFDPNGEVINVMPPVTFLPGGLYLTHSSGAIFYFNTAGAKPDTYVQFPQTTGLTAPPAAAGMSAAYGAVYALAYPPSAGGETISRFDFASQTWTQQSSLQAIAIAANPSPSPGFPVYAVDANGNVDAGATPAPVPYVALNVAIDAAARTANPMMSPAATYIYIYGQQVPVATTAVWQQVANPQGTLAPFPTASATVAPIAFYASPPATVPAGTVTSQTINLPPLNSARIYISNGPLAITTTSGPAPWTNDGSQTTAFDFVEYTWDSHTSTFYVDTTQVDGIGFDSVITLNGSQGVQYTGFKAGAITQIQSKINAIGAPWTNLLVQMPYRILSTDGIVYSPSTTAGTLPGFYPGSFLDQSLLAAWDAYLAPAWLEIDGVGGELGNAPVYGQVDTNGNFNFYMAKSASGVLVATIPSPFNPAYQFGGGVLNGTKYPATWGPATQTVMEQNGPFLLPKSIQVLASPGPMAMTYAFPQNSTYPNAAGTIGNKVSTALNRGIFTPPSPAPSATPATMTISCPPPTNLYPGVPYQNQYAAAVSSVAADLSFGYGQSYTIPYNDQCGFSTTIQDPQPGTLTITINKS